MGGFVEHDVALFLRGLLALDVGLDAALVGLQAVVVGGAAFVGDRVRLLRGRLRAAGLRILHDLLLRLVRRICRWRCAGALARLALGLFLVALLAARVLVERDGLLGARRARVGDLGGEVLPFEVGLDACVVALDEHRHDGFQIRRRLIVRRRDRGPRQRVVVARFAELARIDRQREADVRRHAAQLRRAAVDAEELRDRHLDFAVLGLLVVRDFVEVDEVLHSALAERRLADDDATAVILDCGRENLRGRRGCAIDEHRERTVPGHARMRIFFLFDLAACAAHLHDRALVDEEAGEIGRLGERAAAVVAKIDDDAVDLFLLELAEELLDVARRALVVGVAAAARVEILIEGRQRDDADVARVIAGLDLDHRFLGGLLLDADLLARQRDHGVLAVARQYLWRRGSSRRHRRAASRRRRRSGHDRPGRRRRRDRRP